MPRHEYRLNLLELRPQALELAASLQVRNPRAADLEPLAALVLQAYRGTIDDEGEDLDAARAFVQSSFDDEPLLGASWIASDGPVLVSAILVRRWRNHPLVTFVVT